MKSKYKSLADWKKHDPTCLDYAYRNGLIPIICESFGWELPKVVGSKKPNGYWTLERCIEEALKYNSRREWVKGCRGSNNSAIKNDWMEECCAHMESKVKAKPSGYWTLERCKDEGLKYKTKKAFKIGSASCFSTAYKNGWLEICCKHMENKYGKGKKQI
jgi:hypothetical protein